MSSDAPLHALDLVDVGRTFDGGERVAALRAVSLRVTTGSLTAVLGPSGCGKSTLLRAIAGVERIDHGSIAVGGRLVSRAVPGAPSIHLPPERRRVGLVPQDGALFPHLDAAGNVGFGLGGLDRRSRRARVEELLDLVEMRGYGGRRVDELSGGERQRVALARALAPRPDVVLLDEPFSALDAALRSSLRDQVAELLRRAGTTAVVVTHDRAEAMAIADDLAVMRSGRILQHGPPDELYRRPLDAWCAGVLGDAIVLPCRAGPDRGTVACALGHVSVELPDRRWEQRRSVGPDIDAGGWSVMVRPEQVVPAPAQRTDSTENGRVPARVRAVRFLGPTVAVDLDLGPGLGPAPGLGNAEEGADGIDEPTDRPTRQSPPVEAPHGPVVTVVWPSSVDPSIGDDVLVHVSGQGVLYPPNDEPPNDEPPNDEPPNDADGLTRSGQPRRSGG